MRSNAPEMLGNIAAAVYEGLSPTGKNMLLMKRLIRDYVAPQVFAHLSTKRRSDELLDKLNKRKDIS